MPDSKPKKVIVFGGAGFLGGYVVEELNKRIKRLEQDLEKQEEALEKELTAKARAAGL